MNNTLKTLSSMIVIALFIYMNWASSEGPTVNYDYNVDASIYQDSLIVFHNKDSIGFRNASVSVSLLESPDDKYDEYYFLEGYNLPSFSSDTLSIKDFKDVDGIQYRLDIPPTFVSLAFKMPEENMIINFSKEF